MGREVGRLIDKEAFAEGVQARGDMLYRIARTMLWREADCQGALQECVLKAWAKRHTLRDAALFSTWLTRILINECRSLSRKQRKYHLMAEIPQAPDRAAPDPDLQAALYQLPPKLRLPLVLHHVEGYTLREVAQVLGLPEPTVRGRVHQARRAMRMELEEKEAWQA